MVTYREDVSTTAPPAVDLDQLLSLVRVAVMIETSFQSRRLVFDSNATAGSDNSLPTVSDLKSMAFGNLPMINHNECTKVHRVTGDSKPEGTAAATTVWTCLFKPSNYQKVDDNYSNTFVGGGGSSSLLSLDSCSHANLSSFGSQR